MLFVLVAAFSAGWTVACGAEGHQEPDRFSGFPPFLDSLMVAHGVPGISFAIFDGSGVLFEHVNGLKSAEGLMPIEPETAFEAASISKPIFAYIVLTLARRGVLELDSPLGSLVSEIPDLAYDPRSAQLTPRLLLTHQGGLPNWRSRLNLDARTRDELFAPEDTLRFVSDPGTDYRYSGEGYVLLQRIVEEVTGRDLNDLAQEIVFGPLGMSRSSFAFDAPIQRDYALGHNRESVPDKWIIRPPLASTTLHTTARDLARFGAHMANEIESRGPYATLADAAVWVGAENDLELNWGMGFGILSAGPLRYVYHGGNNVIFIADFIYGVEEDLGYVLLTNSATGPEMVDAVAHRVFGRVLPR